MVINEYVMLVEDDPLTGDCKVLSGGYIQPLQKGINPNSLLNRCKLTLFRPMPKNSLYNGVKKSVG